MFDRRELAWCIAGLSVALCVGMVRSQEPAPQSLPAQPARRGEINPVAPSRPAAAPVPVPAAIVLQPGPAQADRPTVMPAEPVPVYLPGLQPAQPPDLSRLPPDMQRGQPGPDPNRPDPERLKAAELESATPFHAIPEFFGDQAPIGSLLTWPRNQPNGQTLYVPSARYFKISDNDSPQPQNRAYFSFNYFYNLNGPVNEAAGGGIQHTRIHREIFGLEWADKDGSNSFGLRLPINTFNAANSVPGLDGASTDVGDLSIIIKNVIWFEKATHSLVSAGLAITPPTGPGSFAGSSNIEVFHHTTLQPFVGSIWSLGDLYLQHFTAVDIPTDLNDVVMMSNDVALGYFLYQRHHSGGLTAVVPTLEVHVNSPLNHRGVMSLSDPAGNPTMVDLTGGVHFEFNDRSSVGVAFAVPVSGPRMFEFEMLAQLRWRY